MSSPPGAQGTSRARGGQQEEHGHEPRPWVALSRVAVVLGANDERAATMLAPGGPGPVAADLLLAFEPPLRASYLVLPERIGSDDPRTIGATNILAACSSRLLFMAARGDPAASFDFFLADSHARTVSCLPVVPVHIRLNLGLDLVPRRCIGLVADPRHPAGHHMVVQLHPTTPTNRHNTLLCYSTATSQWTAKPLASSTTYQFHEPWGASAVLAHDGLLWWVDIACGMFVCDPFADSPDLRFVPLPANCLQTPMGHRSRAIMVKDQSYYRFIRPSQGKLRYVQIIGFAYDMFTLVNPEGPGHWRFEYTVNFTDIWAHPSYTAASLTIGAKPSLALVDPNNADIVYFFLETLLFAVDRRARRVIGCQEFFVDSTHRDIMYQYSGFIDAWDDTLLDGGSGKQGPDDDAGEQPEESQDQPPPRPWVALSSIAVVPRADDDRTAMLSGADLLLHLEPPLRASYLLLPKRIAPDPRRISVTYILAACSSRLLFMATRGNRTTFDFFLGDALARTVTDLPVIPFHIGLNLVPRRSIGLIADPRHAGHHMVVQLHTNPTNRDEKLLCYSSATHRWTAKPLASTPYPKLWEASGVLTHDGLLWWIDVAYGMLVCDPFADCPDLRFVPLPPNCKMTMAPSARATTLMDDRRFIRPSQGTLRYVQIKGCAYELFTLVNREGPDHWRFEYTMNFADIWDHPSYTAAGLTTGLVPSLGLVDPNNADVVYLFLETSIFAVDGRARRVICCQEFLVDSTHRDLKFQCSCFVNAWELPPTLLGIETSSDSGSRKEGQGPDDDGVQMDAGHAVTASGDEKLASLLSQMEIKSQPDEAVAVPELLRMQEDMAPPPSESSRAAGDQAAAVTDQADAEAEQ